MDLTIDRDKLFELYKPSKKQFSRVDVPELPFAMIDGSGNPQNEITQAAIKALFQAIYPIRREGRKRLGKSFIEPPLEMLYWADDMADLKHGNKDKWHWRAMIAMPAWITPSDFDHALETTKHQLKDTPTLPRLERFEEGDCAQIMHVGSTDDVPAVLDRLYLDYLPGEGLEPAGRYHEIYLNDWSRTAPEKRRIILRQPVRAI